MKTNLLQFISICFLFLSCKKANYDAPSELRVIISHQSMINTPYPQFGFLAKIEGSDKIETIPSIANFEFQPGFKYDLLISKTKVKSKKLDAYGFKYSLVKMINSEKINNVSYDLEIDLSDQTLISYVNKTKYSILNQFTFECLDEKVMKEFEKAIQVRKRINAKFLYIDSKNILTEIK